MPSQGVRFPWTQVPVSVRAQVAEALGSPVVRADNQPGGFSPGVAARCRLEDGRRCFLKAVSSDQNPVSPAMHRREAAIAARLPAGLPVPRLLSVVDDGHWVVLVFDEVDGQPPPQPWTLHLVETALAAIDRIADQTTPCPLPDLTKFADRHADMFSHYRRLAGGDPVVNRVAPWTRENLDLLAELEAQWEPAAAGNSLLHSDIRADNLLVTADGEMVLVDWPHACVGAAWVDKVLFLPSVALDGGPSPAEVEATLDPFRHADPDAVTLVLVGLTGFFEVHGLDPDPPGLPTLRAFQRAQGEVARHWLAHRLARHG